jgi:hypothetical protein
MRPLDFQKLLRRAREIMSKGGDRETSLGEYLRQGIAESLGKFLPCETEQASRVMHSLMNDIQSKWGSHPDNISAFFYGSSRPVHGTTSDRFLVFDPFHVSKLNSMESNVTFR